MPDNPMKPKVLGYALTSVPGHFTPQQVAAVEQAIRDGVLLANTRLDDVADA